MALAAIDPTGASAIGVGLGLVVTVSRRLKEVLKGNEEYRDSIWLKLDTISNLRTYANNFWTTKKRGDKQLLDIIQKVKDDIEKVVKNAETPTSWIRLWNAGKVVLGISPSVKAELESVGTKLNELIQNIDSRRMLEFDKPEARRQLQKFCDHDLERLQANLASELTKDDMKEVRLLTKQQYNEHVKNGVHFETALTTFPTSINMSSSVYGCAKWILDFLRRFEDMAKLVRRDSSNLVKDCLVKLFTEVLPKELKKSLRKRRSGLSADGASLFQQNIRRLRSSLDNQAFRKIRKDCNVQVDLRDSKWKIWEEVVRECEQIKSEKKLPPRQQHGQKLLQQHGHGHGQNYGLQKPKT